MRVEDHSFRKDLTPKFVFEWNLLRLFLFEPEKEKRRSAHSDESASNHAGYYNPLLKNVCQFISALLRFFVHIGQVIIPQFHPDADRLR